MPESSWLEGEASVRRYCFPDGAEWIVHNEYQPETCPDCGKQQYCRLTHIWPVDADGRACQPSYHINRGTDLGQLKTVVVQYVAIAGRQVAVREVETPTGQWVLQADGADIATQAPED